MRLEKLDALTGRLLDLRRRLTAAEDSRTAWGRTLAARPDLAELDATLRARVGVVLAARGTTAAELLDRDPLAAVALCAAVDLETERLAEAVLIGCAGRTFEALPPDLLAG